MADSEESFILLRVYGGWWMVSGDFEENLISLGEDGGWWVVGAFC